MPNFRFEAVDRDGQLIKGVVTAKRSSDLVQRLRLQELTIIDIKEDEGGLGEVLGKLGFKRRLSLYPLAVMFRQLTTLISAGIPITSALETLSWQGLDSKLDGAVRSVLVGIESGKPLSKAFDDQGDLFPALIVPMLRVGEESGRLEEMLDRLALHIERELQLQRGWRQATTYPLFIFLFCVLITLFLVTHVFPVFIGMFMGLDIDLPAATRALITITETIRNPVVMAPVILGGGLGAYLLGRHFRTPVGRRQWDAIRLEIPYLGGLSKKIAFSRLARTIGTLLSCGVPALTTLHVAGLAADNSVIRDSLERVATEMEEGERFSERLAEADLFPELFVQLVHAGEEAGNLPEQLIRIGDLFEEQVELSVATFTSLIEPVMIITMGALVVFILVAVFQPVYQLMATI